MPTPSEECLALTLHRWLTTSDSESENFLTPLRERISPYFETLPHQSIPTDGTEQSNELLAPTSPFIDGAGPTFKSSVCDLEPGFGTRSSNETSISTQKAFRSSSPAVDRLRSALDMQLGTNTFLFQHELRRTSSDPTIRIRNGYHDSSVNSTALQEKINDNSVRSSRPQIRPWLILNGETADNSFQRTKSKESISNFTWFSQQSKFPLASVLLIPVTANHGGRATPFKPNINSAPKSARVNSAMHYSISTTEVQRQQPLRRAQTSEFKDTKPYVIQQFSALEPWLSQPNSRPIDGDVRHGKRVATAKKSSIRSVPSSTQLKVKSTIAGTALTKTNVHVVTGVPSLGRNVSTREAGISPETPTMQIVESQHSSYQVIWEDVPFEDSTEAHRRCSVASSALETVSSVVVNGSDPVNAGLSHRNGGYRPNLQPFAPRVVVFPDDDVSTLTSPTTDSLHDELQDTVAAMEVPDYDAPLGLAAASAHKPKQLPANRRLSGIGDSEVTFRGHRDSLAINRSRIQNSQSTAPGLFDTNDLSSTAKKRVHANEDARFKESVTKAKIATWEPLTSLDFSNWGSSPCEPPGGIGTPELETNHVRWVSTFIKSGSAPSQISSSRDRQIAIEDGEGATLFGE